MSRVLGHQDVRARFLRGLSRNRLHHAWLLYGPAGIGKTMLGSEMAADYLCERNRGTGQGHDACGKCHACHMMAAGSHPDFLYVERLRGKRDLSVDQVRKLLSFLTLSGAESSRRVVLVAGAEQMNPQAANALLKGLEEPATGSLLLMACQDIMRLPAAVRSRCLLQHLFPLSEAECRQVLQEMGMEDEVLEFAAQLAGGQPGKVSALADPSVAEALLEWKRLNRDIERADIGLLQDWIVRYVQNIPHTLIVDVILNRLEPLMPDCPDFNAREQLMRAAWELAAWPSEVARRSLRPGPALLAHLLALRMAMRAPEKAA